MARSGREPGGSVVHPGEHRKGQHVLGAGRRTRVLLAAALQALELPLRGSQHLGRRVGLLHQRVRMHLMS